MVILSITHYTQYRVGAKKFKLHFMKLNARQNEVGAAKLHMQCNTVQNQ